ncbi:MAG: hypothetical protein AABX04_04690 [Nanoarchaeota archaeon]
MTLLNHLKKTAVGLGLLGIMAGCGPSLPPVRAHTDVYYRTDVSPQLKRSNALYDIKQILVDGNNCDGASVDDQKIYCTKKRYLTKCITVNSNTGMYGNYMPATSCTTREAGSYSIGMSWEEVGTRTLTVNGASLEFGGAFNSIHTQDAIQAEQLKQSIEQYLRYR